MELAQARKARIVPRRAGVRWPMRWWRRASTMSSPCRARAISTCSTGCTRCARSCKLVTCRFEAGAVHMAEAYGKLTGRPAAAIVTRGPGACHGAIGVHVAMQDSTPLLLFVGQIPLEEADRERFQEVDYRRMFSPLAKWVTQIDEAKRIPEVVAHAFDVAVSGRPGPVVIALSEEMQKDWSRCRTCRGAGVAAASRSGRAGADCVAMLGRAQQAAGGAGRLVLDRAGRAAIRDFLLGNDIAGDGRLPPPGAVRRHARQFAGDLGVGSDPAWSARRRRRT